MGERKVDKNDVLTEAQIIYDAVSDAAMCRGQELPWWSELTDEQAEVYMERARKKITRRQQIEEKMKEIPIAHITDWLESKGYLIGSPVNEE